MSGTPAPNLAPRTTLTDQAVKAADNVPALISNLSTVNPALAQQITGKAAVASATVWGHIALLLISAAVAKWGLNWDSPTQVEIAGLVAIGAQSAWGVVATWLEKVPITGLFSANPASTTGPKP
jgi:hypothetical protein